MRKKRQECTAGVPAKPQALWGEREVVGRTADLCATKHLSKRRLLRCGKTDQKVRYYTFLCTFGVPAKP